MKGIPLVSYLCEVYNITVVWIQTGSQQNDQQLIDRWRRHHHQNIVHGYIFVYCVISGYNEKQFDESLLEGGGVDSLRPCLIIIATRAEHEL